MSVRPGISPATIQAIERSVGRLATLSVARMDDELPWFRELAPEPRSWVTLVVQTGLQSFVEWLREPDDVLRLTGEVFGAAPIALTRSVSLQQTVELVRQSIAVTEENLPAIAGDDATAAIEQLLRFSREIAFASARVYATAAEDRGSWDRRLEALVIDKLVSGSNVGDPLPSQLAALGWHESGPIFAVVGSVPESAADAGPALAHARTRRLGVDLMVGAHADRLVILVGGGAVRDEVIASLVPAFGPGPIVVGPPAADATGAVAVTQAALSGLRAVGAWPGAPRPVDADALLPERALLGEVAARAHLVEDVYGPLVRAGGGLVETVTAFLDAGGGLEATARALFVHANTVRYRLRRVAEVCGETPTDARGALTLSIALMLGRLDA